MKIKEWKKIQWWFLAARATWRLTTNNNNNTYTKRCEWEMRREWATNRAERVKGKSPTPRESTEQQFCTNWLLCMEQHNYWIVWCSFSPPFHFCSSIRIDSEWMLAMNQETQRIHLRRNDKMPLTLPDLPLSMLLCTTHYSLCVCRHPGILFSRRVRRVRRVHAAAEN